MPTLGLCNNAGWERRACERWHAFKNNHAYPLAQASKAWAEPMHRLERKAPVELYRHLLDWTSVSSVSALLE